jgi:ABC-2 type transport system ATP-binding protein
LKKPVLSIAGLSKSYGSLKALDDLHLEITEGQVFGILGPNGSGKTTTLGIILDVLRPDRGAYYWFGEPAHSGHRKRIGAILEEPVFYPYLSAVDNLKIIAAIKGTDNAKMDDVLEITGLLERKSDKFKTYSFGMRQRLAIAGALLSDPEVLILDEPTNGLDPQGIAEIRELITRIAARGITIIMASHMLDEVQKVCTHVAILQKGKKIAAGSVEEVLHDKKTIEVAANNLEKLQSTLMSLKEVLSVTQENNKLIATVEDTITPEALNKLLFEKNIVANHLALRKKSLEKYFLDLTTNQS